MTRLFSVILIMLVTIASAVVESRKMPLSKLSDMVEKIEMKELLKMPIGSTLLCDGLFFSFCREDVMSMEVPREWSNGAACDALRVSHILFEKDTKRILGGLGSNVYPTIEQGAFVMTNDIPLVVSKISGGKAKCDPLHFNGSKYGEIKFRWDDGLCSTNKFELVVRCFVSPMRQMAVCTLFHKADDGVNAFYAVQAASDGKGDDKPMVDEKTSNK